MNGPATGITSQTNRNLAPRISGRFYTRIGNSRLPRTQGRTRMSISLLTARRAVLAGLAALACGLACPVQARAQDEPNGPAVKFQVKSTTERLEMTVNTSKVVEFPFDVPKMLVNNPDLVRVVPISPKSIQLSALRAGVTQ